MHITVSQLFIHYESVPLLSKTVAHGPLILLQGDLPFGTIPQPLRNPRLTTTLAVGIPRIFRQEQLTVQQSVKRRRGISQMHTDHAVFNFTHCATMLPLDTGSFVALF